MRSIVVSPGDRATDLIGKHHEAAADILHPGEVRHYIMRAGGEEHLGRSGEILRTAAAPGTAMYKDEDRCRIAFGAINVEPLELGLSVSDALGLADAKAHQFAVAD